ESWANAKTGKYCLLTLPERAGAARLPKVEVIDRRMPLSQAPPPESLAAVISDPLQRALSSRLQKSEQSLLLLNRRGYASFVTCGDCGFVAACPNCSISLTYHRTPERLVCHYCQHAEAPQRSCPKCGGTVLRQKGLGTQQVERLLMERFPSARI